MMYYNAFVSSCILLQATALYTKEKVHMCASLEAKSANSSECLNDTSKCEKIPCKKGGCVTVYKNKTGVLTPQYMGCLDIKEYPDCGQESCALELHNDHYSCCCKESMCNINTTLKYPVTKTTHSPGITQAKTTNRTISNDSMLLVYILAPTFSLVFFFGVLAHLYKKRKDTVRRENDHLLEPQQTHSPTLNCRPIQILETVHQGQFARVSKALYLHEVVAVKSIHALQQELWTNEKDIYEKCALQHENIARFISAEKRKHDDMIQYWIITEYCTNGSLSDYLQKFTLSISDLITMSLCILKGLVYLHSGTLTRSSIVTHRDLKSSNILVKSDLTCCIGDFGLSMSFPIDACSVSTDMSQVGTKRYMAPEILLGVITFSPECFLSIDMYAFALVCWELLSRTNTMQGAPDSYQPPYSKEVGYHPTLESMIRCVVEENKRPHLKANWRKNSILNVFCETIEECWDVDAYARVAANLAYLRLSRLTLSDSSSSNENISNASSKEQEKCVESSDST